MTARLQVVISDNLDLRERGEHTDAHETHTISLDGEIRRLDLTTEHSAELITFMRRYLDAGDEPDSLPLPPEGFPQRQAVTSGASGWKVHKDMRDWADRNMPGSYRKREAGRTGYTYAPELRRAYWGSLRDIGSPEQYHPVFADLNGSTP